LARLLAVRPVAVPIRSNRSLWAALGGRGADLEGKPSPTSPNACACAGSGTPARAPMLTPFPRTHLSRPAAAPRCCTSSRRRTASRGRPWRTTGTTGSASAPWARMGSGWRWAPRRPATACSTRARARATPCSRPGAPTKGKPAASWRPCGIAGPRVSFGRWSGDGWRREQRVAHKVRDGWVLPIRPCVLMR